MADHPKNLEALLSQTEPVAAPRRGDLLRGKVLILDEDGLIVDLGKKRDGVVPRSDLTKLPAGEANFKPGDEILVMVVDPEDRDGNLLVSIAQARESGDWLRAIRLMEEEGIIEAVPSDCNRGGLIVNFGRLRAFVPASHLTDLPRGLDEEGRIQHLHGLVGRNMPFKVIEVDPQRRRLVLSERKAIRQWRQDQKSRVIDALQEGEVRKGVVTSLREFGAFVDIGGADGLIHISEISWQRVEDPSQVLQVGQEVEAMVIRLDRQACRIGLSLKRMQPNPWHAISQRIQPGQVVEAIISRIASDGVYACIEDGLEGLLRSAEAALALSPGERVLARVLLLDPEHERLELEPSSSLTPA
jgi:small subunit ribosomal protein S1